MCEGVCARVCEVCVCVREREGVFVCVFVFILRGRVGVVGEGVGG